MQLRNFQGIRVREAFFHHDYFSFQCTRSASILKELDGCSSGRGGSGYAPTADLMTAS